MNRASAEHQRRERWRGRHDRVAEALSHRESGAVAAALRQRLAAGREHDRRGAQLALIRDDPESAVRIARRRARGGPGRATRRRRRFPAGARRARRARGSCRETAFRRLPRAAVTPISRKKAIVSATGNARRTRRMMAGRPPQKSRSVTTALVTLQRDPPLTRILAPGFRAPSRSTTERVGLKRRVKMAVARPAAPAPTTATSQD